MQAVPLFLHSQTTQMNTEKIHLEQRYTRLSWVLITQGLPNPRDRIKFIAQTISSREKLLLRTMSYPEFLQTIYWKIIRDYILDRANGECERCGITNQQFDVHHAAGYAYRGQEYAHLGDLEALCRRCHTEELVVTEDQEKEVAAIIAQVAAKKRIPKISRKELWSKYGDIDELSRRKVWYTGDLDTH